MTNFEKWKENIKIKDLTKFYTRPSFHTCPICPATDYCYILINRGEEKDCPQTIEEWADMEIGK